MPLPRLGATPENAGPVFWRVGCLAALPTCVSLWRGRLPGGRACRKQRLRSGPWGDGRCKEEKLNASNPLPPRSSRRFLAMRAGRSTGPKPRC